MDLGSDVIAIFYVKSAINVLQENISSHLFLGHPYHYRLTSKVV